MKTTRIYHSDEEWLELITKSRVSGLSDADWCRRNGVPTSSFYNAVSRLRKKACSIPDPVDAGDPETVLDLTSASQDVVPIRIDPEPAMETGNVPVCALSVPHLDNSHSIEILLGSARVRICNGTDPALLSAVLASLGKLPC